MPKDCPEIIYMYLSNMPFWGRQSMEEYLSAGDVGKIVSEGALHLGQDSVHIPLICAW